MLHHSRRSRIGHQCAECDDPRGRVATFGISRQEMVVVLIAQDTKFLQSMKQSGGFQSPGKFRERYFPQHFLYFFPLPQGQGAFRPIFGSVLIIETG